MEDYTEIMNHYTDFLMKVIDSSSKTFSAHRKFTHFSRRCLEVNIFLMLILNVALTNSSKIVTKLEVACHPEYLNNRKFTKTHKVEYAEKSDQLFNEVRKYFNIHSECTDGVDMVSLRKGTPAYKLLLRKEKEQAERQKEAYAKGKGNFQLAAKTELKKRRI